MTLILASSSPRRRELLERTGRQFEVIASPADEIHDATLAPHVLCEKNAELKARAVAESRPDAVVIGADTLVFLDGEPLGKPRDMREARAMLSRLSGRTHEVCTGVCVCVPGGDRIVFHDTTTVVFRVFDQEVIDRYFARVNPLDKAGSYGIQEHGGLIVDRIDGSFDNVMGLPVDKLMEALERMEC